VDKSGKVKKNRVLTLDIKNTFNSALWSEILTALREKDIPMYIRHLVEDYFKDQKCMTLRMAGQKSHCHVEFPRVRS